MKVAAPSTSRRRAELIRLVVEGGRKVSEVAAEAELHEMTVYREGEALNRVGLPRQLEVG